MKNLAQFKAQGNYLILIAVIVFVVIYTFLIVEYFNWQDARIFRSPIVFQDPILVREDIESLSIPIDPYDGIPVTTNSPITLKVSNYWPPSGGTNCANFVDGVCKSKMASGKKWEDWLEYGMACPVELEFGTKIEIGDQVWECQDRGGAITKIGDVYWVDLLTFGSPYYYGEIVQAMEIVGN